MKKNRGFTLIEVLIVVAIVAIIAAVIMPNFSESRAQSRDAERQSDLRTLQGAIELYHQKHGTYPLGCNIEASDSNQSGAWVGGTDFWSGELGTDYECDSGDAEYIVGLVPEFIPRLPTDPKPDGTDSGYVYITNPEGSVYKLMAHNVAEVDVITYDSAFSRCGNMILSSVGCSRIPASPSGGGSSYVLDSTGGTEAQCSTASEYNNDYAVWGGFAPGGGGYSGSPYRETPRAREYYSDKIHCR